MAKKNVLVQSQVQAMNIDALNRSAIATKEIENGMVFQLATISETDGESEVWKATAPATGALKNLWMAYDPEVTVVTVNGKEYRGLTPDPRDFAIPTGKVFSAFKPVAGDILLVALGEGADQYAEGDLFLNAVDASEGLVWGTTQTADALSFRLIEVSYISIADGSIGNQRVPAYRLECVAN